MKNSDLQNSDPPKKRHSKRELAFFKSSSWLFQLSHFVKIYRQTHNNHIQVQKEKEKCVICLCYPQNNKLGAVTVVWGSEFHRSFFFSGGGEYRGGGEYGGGGGGLSEFSSQIFLWGLSFLGLSFPDLRVSGFLGLRSEVWVFYTPERSNQIPQVVLRYMCRAVNSPR